MALTTCPWAMPDGSMCGEERERNGTGAYCAEHRREYQRNRYASKASGEAVGAPETAQCSICTRALTTGIRKTIVNNALWCGYCVQTAQYLIGAKEGTRRRLLAHVEKEVGENEDVAILNALAQARNTK